MTLAKIIEHVERENNYHVFTDAVLVSRDEWEEIKTVCAALEAAEAAKEPVAQAEAYAYQARFWVPLYGKEQWSKWQSCTREQHEAVQRGETLYGAKAESLALYTSPQPAAPSSAEQPSGIADALHDSAYIAGLQEGWNRCAEGDSAGFQSIIAARAGYLNPIREARAAKLAAPGAPEADERQARINAAIVEHERIGAGHELDQDAYFARILSAADAARAQSSAAPSVAPVSARDGGHDAEVIQALRGDLKEYQSLADRNQRDARRYREVRRGQHWSVIDGAGETLRADALDAAADVIVDRKFGSEAPPADARDGELRERCAQIAESADIAPTDDPLGVQQQIADMIRRDQLTRPLNDSAMGGE